MEENQTEIQKIEEHPQLTKEEIFQERGNKLIRFLKKPIIWTIGILILLIILGIYIRIQPMKINPNTGKPGLWDITTNTWTLGPDLDPWLFTRYAQIIVEQGSLPKIDMLRNIPLGFNTQIETPLLPNMIVWTYYILNFFGEYSVMFAAVIFPVIMFVLIIISSFLFVRELFIKKGKTKANIISLISTLFMIVIPAFLSRTLAGIPEKESAAFFFLFLSFYLFLKAWNSEKTINYIILAILAGFSTACLGAIWGGVLYAFITIALATLVSFILNKIHKKELIIYSLWVLSSFSLLILFSQRVVLSEILISLDTSLVSLVLFILIIHLFIWNTKLKNIKMFNTQKIPKNIISLIIAFILGCVALAILFGPSFLINKLDVINHALLTPTTGRWQVTVAENRQPYFTEWGSSFGPLIKNIPILFWLFFIGSVVLFKEMFNELKKRDLWILIGLYVLFFFGIVFSRYSNTSIFNGENFSSKLFYFGSALLLIGFLVYYFIKYSKEENRLFERINFEYIFIFSLFIFCLMTARGAIRLIMVLAPIAPIFIGYSIIISISAFKKDKDEIWKIALGVFIAIILIGSVFTLWAFYKESKGQASVMIPSHYNQQWQKAMSWARTETPQNSVFASWWDYGYWIQSIGNRATVTDGGNAIILWNYWTGRLVLTGDNEKDALDFLYSHNTSYFLIDSSDIGKYTAYSSIGSNIDYDRYSWFGTFLLDEKQTQETKNQTVYFYGGGGVALDEDLIIKENGKEILLPRGVVGVGAIILPTIITNYITTFEQPYILVVYQGFQHKIDLRYLSINGEFKDFGSGIEATAFIFPRLNIQGQGISKNSIGAAMFISPRLMRGMMAQIYILDDPLNKFPNFKTAHTEPNLIVADLKRQGMDLPDFIYFQGIQGPIKIWKINYTGQEQVKSEYLDRVASKYLNWSL